MNGISTITARQHLTFDTIDARRGLIPFGDIGRIYGLELGERVYLDDIVEGAFPHTHVIGVRTMHERDVVPEDLRAIPTLREHRGNVRGKARTVLLRPKRQSHHLPAGLVAPLRDARDGALLIGIEAQSSVASTGIAR